MSQIDFSLLPEADYSSLTFESYDPEDVTTEEKIRYGAMQETMIGGNLLRYGKAAVDSMFDANVSFDEALQQIESDRQRDIFREMPQFYGITEDQEDGAILTGRVGSALIDPVTWALPWLKVAKAGKLASTTFGAGVAGADVASRQYLTQGEVDPLAVGISAGVGGATGLLSAALASKMGVKGRESLEAAIKDPAPVPMERQPFQYFKDLEELQVLTGERTLPTGLLDDIEIENVTKAAARVIPSEKIDEVVRSTPLMASNTQAITDLRKTVDALRNKKNKAKGEAKKELNAQLKEAQALLQTARKKYFDTQVENKLTKIDLNGAVLEDLSEKGELTESIMAKVLQETVRPVVGGLGGFAASGIVADEDDDALTATLILAGAGFGAAHKRLMNSTMTAVEKETGRLIVDKNAKSFLKRIVKVESAGSTATRLDALGGYAKIIGNMLFQRPGAATDSVEARAIRETRAFTTKINETIGDSLQDMNVRKLVGQIINDFDVDDIEVGYRGIDGTLKPVTAEQIAEARRITPLIAQQRDELADSMRQIGIKFEDLGDQYGMAQIINFQKVAGNADDFERTMREVMKLEFPKLSESKIIDKAQVYADRLLGVNKYKEGTKYTPDNVFVKGEFRPLTDHFEKSRMIKNEEARKLLASSGYLNLDVSEVMTVYGERSIKAREFADSFGPQGQFLSYAFDEINKSFRGLTGKDATYAQNYKKSLLDSIDAYWGAYGSAGGNAAQTALASLTTLANMSFLTRVSITSIGDLIQPFQNSGFGAATKAILQKVGSTPSFSKQVQFQYDNSFEREFTALMMHGGDPTNSIQARANFFNKGFFKLVQLERITKAARGFAYDSGINRAFEISRKNKFNRAINREMETIGLSRDNIDVLKKYKTAKEAFNSDDGRAILDRVGQKIADRDAILPMVGNRRLFTQSKNPWIRSLGQFLSWAQAKTAQTNSLIERVEDGDVALALRGLSLTGIYAGVQYLREGFKPTGEFRLPEDEEEAVRAAAQALELSANYMPWHINKAVRQFQSPMNQNFMANLSPSTGLVENLWDGFTQAWRNLSKGDYEGTTANLIKLVPFGREALGYAERFDIPVPEDRPSRAKGGIITDVPNAPEEPDQRIDKMTGMPYDQQAGTAFVDEEDPLRRLGFKGGGKVDPLQRLGFGLGSLVARQVSKAIRSTDGNIPTTVNKDDLIQEFDGLTSAINKGETPEMFKETVSSPKPTKVSSTDVDDTIAPYEDIPAPATYDEMFKALASDKKKKINVEIPEGRQVGIRLDIPAYLRKKDSAWVPTIHDETKGGVTSHRGTVSITNVDLTMSPSKQKASLDIREGDKMKAEIDRLAEQGALRTGFRTGDMSKGKLIDATTPEGKKQIAALKKQYDKKPFARIGGNLVNRTDEENFSLAKKYLKDPEWTQVGFNPMKHSYFFDRRTGDPVIGGEEAIQVGPLVLVKNAIKGDRKDFLFSKGGKVLRALKRNG